MATITEARYSTEYTGLISTAGLALGFVTIMTLAFESFTRLPRHIARRERPGGKDEPASVEDYVMAYLYRPRAFLGKNRGPQLPKWPLAWIWQVLRLPQDFYLRHSGLDSAVYVRFVTGCWFFMLSQLLTTVIILLPLHIYYAPDSVLPSSIAQASVSSLIDSTTGGRNYLWVRTVLLWWQTGCWISVLVYVGWGNIRMRREQILDPLRDAKDGDLDAESPTQTYDGIPPGVNPRGWRFRTVKVSNIPHQMRNEAALRAYFQSCLDFIKKNPTSKLYKSAVRSGSGTPNGDGTSTPAGAQVSSIDHVVIVRRLNELHQLVKKRRQVLHELESAHLQLARNAMNAVAARVRVQAHSFSFLERILRQTQPAPDEALDQLVDVLGAHLPYESLELKMWQDMHPEKRAHLPDRTIWETLSDIPKELLDPYHPVVKLKMFKGQTAPSVDYYLTKLNLLSSLIEDLRARPDTYAACDTAFVTFSKASDARLIRKELSWIRARALTCRVRPAPDARDLEWDKLIESNFTEDVLKAFVVHAFVWIGTIIWIIPMGALVGLVSLDNLSTRIAALARWLDNHQKAKSLFSSLVPTIIVAVVNMLVPTIIIQVSGRGQTFVTFSKLHHSTWCRFWVWLIINVVIAFCAGTALFTSILGIFTGQSFSDTADNPLNIIASSFSNGAVFFVSYTILIIGTQCFFELGQFMIPWFLYLGVRKATSPRQRFDKCTPRRFFAYTVSPNHTLVVSVILTFSLLNPLPICFTFIYFSFAVVIFKDHFARLYWRVYYELNGRLIYMRVMRYSLDAMVLGQVVNMALFFVLKDGKNGGACAALIPLTVFVKLTLTRWYDAHMDAADAAFADAVCNPEKMPNCTQTPQLEEPGSPAHPSSRRTVNDRLRALGLPELTFRATIKAPWTDKTFYKTAKGPQAIITRLAKHLQHADVSSELRAARAFELASSQAVVEQDNSSAEKTLNALEHTRGLHAKDPEKSETIASKFCHEIGVKVIPHPKLQRDDRPDYSSPYVDPYLLEPLEKFLWLPRNPLYDIDLDDTIEWHSRALVSSEGGNGNIGGWNPEDDETQTSTLDESQKPYKIERTTDLPAESGEEEASSSQTYAQTTEDRPPKSLLPSAAEHTTVEAESHSSQGDSKEASSAALTGHRMLRSISVGDVFPHSTGTDVKPLIPIEQLRRFHSEIMDSSQVPSRIRSSTLKSRHKAPRRQSSGQASGQSDSAHVSRRRALTHEILYEERHEAAERKRLEDTQAQEHASKAKSSWRRFFMKPKEDAD